MMFIDGLMAFPTAGRPTAEQALQHGFLSPASLANAGKDMQLCLPGFDVKKDLLPLVPLGRCLPAAITGSGWGIGALHGTAPMQCEDDLMGALGHVADLAAVVHASADRSAPDRGAADTPACRYGCVMVAHMHT